MGGGMMKRNVALDMKKVMAKKKKLMKKKNSLWLKMKKAFKK